MLGVYFLFPQIIVYLVQQWLTSDDPKTPGLERSALSFSTMTDSLEWEKLPKRPTVQSPSYQITNSPFFFLHKGLVRLTKAFSYEDLLRVIKYGLRVKSTVDKAIEACAQVFNLHKAIEDARIAAEETTDERRKLREIQRGP